MYKLEIKESNPTADLFAEYSLGMKVQALADYLYTTHSIEADAEAYNRLVFNSEKDFTTATLVISGFDDIKIA